MHTLTALHCVHVHHRSCGPGTAELHSTAVCLREAIGSFISLMMLHLGACIYSLLYSVSLPPLIRLDHLFMPRPFAFAPLHLPPCICPFPLPLVFL